MKKEKTNGAVFANISIGIQLAITILLFVYIGYRLDLHYDKSPLFLSLGTVIGMVLGFYHLLKELNNLEERKKRNEDKEKRNKSKWM